jgi:hypothetical protein
MSRFSLFFPASFSGRKTFDMRTKALGAALVILIVLLFASVLFMQKNLSPLYYASNVAPSMAYLPQSEKIRPWLLGFHTVYADFLWIKTTLYFGGHLLSDRQFPWLVQMIDIVTRLNPDFFPAFEFGGLLIPEVCKNPNAGRIILERGLCSHFEKKWKLYFYLGMLYNRYFNDNGKAALCFAVAAQLPGAPEEKLVKLSRHFLMESPGSSQTNQLLQLMYSTSENPAVRRYLMSQLHH